MLPAATQSLTTYRFGTFQLIVSMWKPIIAVIDSGNVSGQLGAIGPFLAEEAKRLTVKILSCMVEETTFGK